jgi:hypothetical protein
MVPKIINTFIKKTEATLHWMDGRSVDDFSSFIKIYPLRVSKYYWCMCAKKLQLRPKATHTCQGNEGRKKKGKRDQTSLWWPMCITMELMCEERGCGLDYRALSPHIPLCCQLQWPSGSATLWPTLAPALGPPTAPTPKALPRSSWLGQWPGSAETEWLGRSCPQKAILLLQQYAWGQQGNGQTRGWGRMATLEAA